MSTETKLGSVSDLTIVNRPRAPEWLAALSAKDGFLPGALSVALTLGLMALWLVTHRFTAFSADGQIYAVQALARLHTTLTGDLYLQNTSQDEFTLFSPVYAWFIAWLGLAKAAQLLFVVFTLWFFAASWQLANCLFGRALAWISVAFLVVIAGDYGAFGVFRYSETFLTARLPAEALLVTAFACHFRGFKVFGLLLAASALTMHPLMALPGLLLLACLWFPIRISLGGAVAGILGVLFLALAAAHTPAVRALFPVMDAPWLEVVRERSQFLFLQLWSIKDWELAARSFACLSITMTCMGDAAIRKFCLAAMLVGLTGLVVGAIASSVGPVALLLQGQAWRWIWITTFIGILTLAPTAYRLWQDKTCGPLCAVLLICGWTVGALNGTACVFLASILWSLRKYITASASKYFRWGAAALAALVIVWVVANSWTIIRSAPAETGREPAVLGQIRNIMGLEISALTAFGLFWYWIGAGRQLAAPVGASLCLLVLSIWLLPASFRQIQTFEQIGTVSSSREMRQFADWRKAIPPTSTVFVTNGHDSGSFVWFTLERPNYLSVGQSAGVVFSRATALEVRRRSDVLLPVMDAQWKLLTSWKLRARHETDSKYTGFRTLTAETLSAICSDPLLGFVISRDTVNVPSIRHVPGGPWKDWRLYDCRDLRGAPTS